MTLAKELYKATRSTRLTTQKAQYYLDIPEIVNQLTNNISSFNYNPLAYTCFAITDTVPREIFAPHFCDRIVHRWLINKMEPFIDKRLLSCSYANRKNKGHHKAVKKLQYALNNPANKYYLKMDVESFFNTIDHAVLLSLLCRWTDKLPYLAEERKIITYLCKVIVKHNPTANFVFTGDRRKLKSIPSHKSYFYNPFGRGLPLGNLSSQFFANIYLHELDWFVKHKLQVRYYFRYVDDFVLLAETPEQLKSWHNAIADFLEKELKLHPHPQKTILQPTHYGIDFLGYIIKKDYLLVRKRVVKIFKQKLYFYNHLFHPEKYPYLSRLEGLGNGSIEKRYKNGQLIPPIPPNKKLLELMLCSINSYYGVFKMADTFHLRKTFYMKHFKGLQKYFYATNQFTKIGLLKKYLR